MKISPFRGVLPTLAFTTVITLLSAHSFSAEETTAAALATKTHFHGVAVNSKDPSRVYLATHHGFYVVTPDGVARRASKVQNDFMGFTPHPTDPDILYASGHPASGGNLGFIVSTDGGETWIKRSDGVNGPIDFHQMDVSKANPQVIVGAHRGLQVSRNGGHSWEMVGPLPEKTLDLAASATDVNVFYAATERGLLRSKDGGKSWHDAYFIRRPTTMVQSTAGGMLYAFIIGRGLVRTIEPELHWKTVGKISDSSYILHFAADASDPGKMYAIAFDSSTKSQSLIASQDGGTTWTPLGGR